METFNVELLKLAKIIIKSFLTSNTRRPYEKITKHKDKNNFFMSCKNDCEFDRFFND